MTPHKSLIAFQKRDGHTYIYTYNTCCHLWPHSAIQCLALRRSAIRTINSCEIFWFEVYGWSAIITHLYAPLLDKMLLLQMSLSITFCMTFHMFKSYCTIWGSCKSSIMESTIPDAHTHAPTHPHTPHLSISSAIRPNDDSSVGKWHHWLPSLPFVLHPHCPLVANKTSTRLAGKAGEVCCDGSELVCVINVHWSRVFPIIDNTCAVTNGYTVQRMVLRLN